MGTFTRKTITKDEMLDLMAGGEEMHKLSQDLAGVAI
jgi:simple sugar transport system ATP-binding protein